jgi:hypothetical protein
MLILAEIKAKIKRVPPRRDSLEKVYLFFIFDLTLNVG